VTRSPKSIPNDATRIDAATAAKVNISCTDHCQMANSSCADLNAATAAKVKVLQRAGRAGAAGAHANSCWLFSLSDIESPDASKISKCVEDL
jgi:hypothetical protein